LPRNHQLFESAGLPQLAYEPYLEKLINAAPRTEQGIINQIFLPKENIERYLYFSMSGGLLHPEQNRNIHATIQKFQQDRVSPSFDSKKNVQVRILAGSLFEEAVEIYRYSLIPKQARKAYEQFVEEVLQAILCAISV